MLDQNKNPDSRAKLTTGHGKNHHTLAEKILIPIFLGIFIFVIVFSGGYVGYAYAYKDKIYPGVKIAGYNVGGLSKEETLKTINKKIDKLKEIGINIVGDKEENVKYEDLGISFDAKKTVDNLYDLGRDGNTWTQTKTILAALFDKKNKDLIINTDQEKFPNKLNDLFRNKYKETKNATFKVENEELSIVKEEYGQGADADLTREQIIKVANSENIYKPVEIIIKKTNPSITVEEITPLKPEVENHINKNIVLTWDKYNFTPSKGEIINWLVLTKDPNKNEVKITFSDEAIKNYIKDTIAAKVDKKAINKQINSQTSAVITEGQDGQVVNQNKVLEQIKNALSGDNTEIALEVLVKEKEEVKVEPKEITQAGGTAGMTDGKYIEINLSQQKLYIFEGGNQLGAYSVSTGKWSMPTPTGTRYIQGKEARAWSNKYGLYMPYWNDIGGGYGIHELPEWPGGYKEGEGHLGTPVSHGCIRLGVGAAETVYNWAAIGTPVFIHQ